MKRNLRNKHLFILFAILCLTGCTAIGNNDVKPVMSEDPDAEEAADRYVGTYLFTDAEPDISFEVLERREGQWRYSDEFQKDVLKEGLVGNVWLNDTVRYWDK